MPYKDRNTRNRSSLVWQIAAGILLAELIKFVVSMIVGVGFFASLAGLVKFKL